MSEQNRERFSVDGVEWTRYDYGPGDVWFQRKCPADGCLGGMQLAPARWCSVCAGSGHLVQSQDPRPA